MNAIGTAITTDAVVTTITRRTERVRISAVRIRKRRSNEPVPPSSALSMRYIRGRTIAIATRTDRSRIIVGGGGVLKLLWLPSAFLNNGVKTVL